MTTVIQIVSLLLWMLMGIVGIAYTMTQLFDIITARVSNAYKFLLLFICIIIGGVVSCLALCYAVGIVWQHLKL